MRRTERAGRERGGGEKVTESEGRRKKGTLRLKIECNQCRPCWSWGKKNTNLAKVVTRVLSK